jgi:hypothetical protein
MYDPFAHLDEATKHIVDIVSAATVLGTLTEMLPSISAIFTIIWVCIRIYETDTVQRVLGNKGGRRKGDDHA